MPRNEEGEFELVLGNRQLLSVFFIVVILLGVFFTMGYIVGRNSAPAVPDPTLARRLAAEQPGPSPAGTAITSEMTKSPPAGDDGSRDLAPGQVLVNQVAPSGTRTMPAQPPTMSLPVATAPATKAAPPAAPPARAPVGSHSSLSLASVQPGQTYWQVVAGKRPDAELIASVLRKKGFLHTVVVPGPNESLFRVLVGPIKDPDALAKTKVDLEGAGFKPMIRKY